MGVAGEESMSVAGRSRWVWRWSRWVHVAGEE